MEMELPGSQSGSTTTAQNPTFTDHIRERTSQVDPVNRLAKEMFATDQAVATMTLVLIQSLSIIKKKKSKKIQQKTKQPNVANNAVPTVPTSAHSSIPAGPSTPAVPATSVSEVTLSKTKCGIQPNHSCPFQCCN